ncbi:WAP four-disulfide core domain protein 12-like isoform X3 [Vombatus ursinus]|uniref:WAP four-disulfide core domain protein 12-like isoform X3 n=1 Tax=Vombatus ursinus TaxID=29139 RepID=UPI000FFD9A74|nr:WAP four-disulfide core domain protein 12-like isoform X3 [Vombatus ursinus]
MKSRSLFFLVASLALVMLASSGTLKPAKKGTKKAGSCPDDPFRCIRGEPSECVGDEQCPQNQKCCYYHCGFKCVHPKETNNKAKAGQCPPKTNLCLTPNQCEDDGHCLGNMKCCEGMCGKVCTVPVTD